MLKKGMSLPARPRTLRRLAPQHEAPVEPRHPNLFNKLFADVGELLVPIIGALAILVVSIAIIVFL
jgi:hypothetical protein